MQPRTRWSERIYDYECGAVMDEEAAGVDLAEGRWVRCRRCDVHVDIKTPFVLIGWASHKRSPAHVRNMQDRAGNAHREPAKEADFADAMMESANRDTDYLALFRQELDTRAKEQAKAKDLMLKTAMLVTEQQEDIDALRTEVVELKDVIHDLRCIIEELHRPHDCVCSSRPRRYGTGQLSVNQGDMRGPFPCRRVAESQESPDASDVEIDMFDDEVHLMQMN